MNKYFLLCFALLLAGLYAGLRAGSWLSHSKPQIKIVKVKAKAPPQKIRVVKVEVPKIIPLKCDEPIVTTKRHRTKRTVASVQKPVTETKKALPVEKPVTPPSVVPESERVTVQNLQPAALPAVQTQQQKQMDVKDAAKVPVLAAPTIKSIQTED